MSYITYDFSSEDRCSSRNVRQNFICEYATHYASSYHSATHVIHSQDLIYATINSYTKDLTNLENWMTCQANKIEKNAVTHIKKKKNYRLKKNYPE